MKFTEIPLDVTVLVIIFLFLFRIVSVTWNCSNSFAALNSVLLNNHIKKLRKPPDYWPFAAQRDLQSFPKTIIVNFIVNLNQKVPSKSNPFKKRRNKQRPHHITSTSMVCSVFFEKMHLFTSLLMTVLKAHCHCHSVFQIGQSEIEQSGSKFVFLSCQNLSMKWFITKN